jgi:hypothetical protein
MAPHAPPDQPPPRVQAAQPQAASAPRRGALEALSVVGAGQLQAGGGALQGHVRLARARMSGDVAQGLLGDAVEAEAHVLRDGPQVVGGARDREAVLAADLGAMRSSRRDQAGMLERARVQVVRHVTDVLGERDRLLLQTDHLLLRLSHLRRQPALEAAAGDAQGGELLAEVVMQLAGDAGALGLLGRDQASDEALDLLVAGAEGRFVSDQRLRFVPPFLDECRQ